MGLRRGDTTRVRTSPLAPRPPPLTLGPSSDTAARPTPNPNPHPSPSQVVPEGLRRPGPSRYRDGWQPTHGASLAAQGRQHHGGSAGIPCHAEVRVCCGGTTTKPMWVPSLRPTTTRVDVSLTTTPRLSRHSLAHFSRRSVTRFRYPRFSSLTASPLDLAAVPGTTSRSSWGPRRTPRRRASSRPASWCVCWSGRSIRAVAC